MNRNIKINRFNSRDELFSSVAGTCQKQLSDILSRNDKASFIIPGGTTPAPAFDILSSASLDWSKITIAQSDERWVNAEHPQSNQGLTAKTLLINNASNAIYLPMKNNQSSVKSGEAECNALYQKLPMPISLTMLGMGLDGHFASLFPHSNTIEEAMDLTNKNLCVAMDATGCKVAGDFPERMSLTLSAILNSEIIIVLVTGKEKLAVIEKASKENDPSNYPISALLHQTNTPVEFFWSE